ncbi:hypothetical protein GCM10023320_09180 [Pseudonocardia adelaidensis]|uniref:Uncharacterized protein n=1 Tax=Pseudonocardia adelaidensis TaxID=648754 RepID=A0ABP9NCU8_9PSEU
MQAIRSTRPGGHVGYVGVSHDVTLDGLELFFSGVHLHGRARTGPPGSCQITEITMSCSDGRRRYSALLSTPARLATASVESRP